jgi:subtilisin family serine protease
MSGTPRYSAESLSKASITRAELGEKEFSSLKRDSNKLIAPTMPYSLFDPLREEATQEPTEISWGVEAVQANVSSLTGNGSIVAILDTGIDKKHEAFQNLESIVEKDFSGDGNGDRNGHGTHCAGTAFGADVQGTRIGVAKGVRKAIIGKVLNDNGGGNTSSIVEGVLWACEQGANVISMSLGVNFSKHIAELKDHHGLPNEAAISEALDTYSANIKLMNCLADFTNVKSVNGEPCVIVAATGNDSSRPDYKISCGIPAIADQIISVGSLCKVGDHYSMSSFSNIHPRLCAPGSDIVSASTGGGLVSFSGTSMATPHVAGVAALVLEKLRTISPNFLNSRNLTDEIIACSSSDNILLEGLSIEDFGRGLIVAPCN